MLVDRHISQDMLACTVFDCMSLNVKCKNFVFTISKVMASDKAQTRQLQKQIFIDRLKKAGNGIRA